MISETPPLAISAQRSCAVVRLTSVQRSCAGDIK
ncbi:MAG: hypothetical protein AEth_00273 [Candidatus Argoarchaeum ethanivorans]|uniref:Uncharacterized protein n=1 Tax=Candidatus Argoarchaeum ethanivorans TaxID=2608793 RepID=A0A8B3S5T1_9EURY|nr:MAG: hypothetical protein AEth_00273 [Candidatus Argoarchaeum ethanivorans]